MTQTNGTTTQTDAATPTPLDTLLAGLDERSRRYEIPAALLSDALERLHLARARHAQLLAAAQVEMATPDETDTQPESEYEFLTGEKLPAEEEFHAAFTPEGPSPLTEKNIEEIVGYAAGDRQAPHIDSIDPNEREDAIAAAMAGTDPGDDFSDPEEPDEEGDEDEADLPPHTPAAATWLMHCPACLVEHMVDREVVRQDGLGHPPFCGPCFRDAGLEVALVDGPPPAGVTAAEAQADDDTPFPEPVAAATGKSSKKKHKKHR